MDAVINHMNNFQGDRQRLEAVGVATYIFNHCIWPWLVENNFDVIAGNREWVILDGDDYVSEDRIPQEILGVLNLVLPGTDQSVGSLMPSTRREQ